MPDGNPKGIEQDILPLLFRICMFRNFSPQSIGQNLQEIFSYFDHPLTPQNGHGKPPKCPGTSGQQFAGQIHIPFSVCLRDQVLPAVPR